MGSMGGMYMGELVKTAREFVREEDAVGVVEIILVIIFKDQLTNLVNAILSKITKQSNSI